MKKILFISSTDQQAKTQKIEENNVNFVQNKRTIED